MENIQSNLVGLRRASVGEFGEANLLRWVDWLEEASAEIKKEIDDLKEENERLTKEITQLQSPEPGWDGMCPYGCKPAGVYRDRYLEIQVELGVCCDHEDLITEIRDLVTKNKRLQDQINRRGGPCAADELYKDNQAKEKQVDEKTAHVERLLRGMKRLTKANEKLKKDFKFKEAVAVALQKDMDIEHIRYLDEQYKRHCQAEKSNNLRRRNKGLTTEIKKLKEEIVEKDKAKRCLCPPRLGVRAGYTDEEWDVLGSNPIKEGEPQIIDYYHK